MTPGVESVAALTKKETLPMDATNSSVTSIMKPVPTPDQTQIVFERLRERHYQDKVWGQQNDDRQTIHDWITYITKYLGRLAEDDPTSAGQPVYERYQLTIIAALYMAAIESSLRRECIQGASQCPRDGVYEI